MRGVAALIRFSFLYSDERGFRLARDRDADAREAALFSERRLERRFGIFERVCLPSLLAQPEEEFCAVVLASRRMPALFRERLGDALSGRPNLVAAFEDPLPFPGTEAFLRHLGEVPKAGNVLLTCRLDDDDALGAGYTEAALPYVAPHHVGYCVTFSRGVQAARVRGEVRFWETDYPLIAAGLGLVTTRDGGTCVYECGHHRQVWSRHPTIVDAREPQYLTTLHGENDSTTPRRLRERLFRRRRHANPLRNPPPRTSTRDEVRTRFPGVFPALDQEDWSFL